MIEVNSKTPAECGSISDVRDEIDNIDKFVVRLLRERFDYVREVVKYKEKTASGIVAEDRRAAALADRRKWAEEAGLSPDVIEEIYSRLIQYFIDEEMKIANLK